MVFFAALPGKCIFHESTDCNVEPKGSLGEEQEKHRVIIVDEGENGLSSDHKQSTASRF